MTRACLLKSKCNQWWLLVLAILPAPVTACPSAAEVATMVRDWTGLAPLRGLGAQMSMAHGSCARDRFVAALAQTHGPIVGYKAGLTNKALQQRFGYAEPVRGALLQKMLLEDGAQVAARFGARPVYEADLLVEIGDGEIQRATTHLEALRSIARVTAFVELPDLVLAEGEPVTGPIIAAINVGARLGVAGASVRAEATQAFADALADMQVVVTDQTGSELARARGTAILEHPLNAVLWLAQDLARSGVALKRGDVLSLGSFTPPLPPRSGSTITVRYVGLPGTPSVSVTFK
jgi:2-keto-4-pentenoate hydratase